MMRKFTLAIFVFCFTAGTISAQWDSIATANQVISGMKTYNNQLFIGGDFTLINGQTSYWSAYYDGVSFTPQTTMIGGSGISKMDVFGTDLYCVGGLEFFSTIGVGVWDGSTWQDGGSTNYSHSLVCAVGNNLYVQSDDNKLRQKTGSGSFQPFYTFPSGGATALFNYNGNLVVAGSFDSIGGTIAKNIAMWNGTNWSPLGTGISTGAKAMALYNGELYVAGSIASAGGTTVSGIAKWNGTSWSAVSGGVTGSNHNGLRGMVVYRNNLIVVGDVSQMGGVNTSNVAAWNGSAWTGLNLQHPDNFVNTVEVLNDELYVGTFSFSHAHVYKYSGALGISAVQKENDIRVYPNPFNNQFKAEVSGNGNYTITLRDITGRKTLQQSFTHSVTVNTEQLASGVYFYEMYDANGTIGNGKLLKQ